MKIKEFAAFIRDNDEFCKLLHKFLKNEGYNDECEQETLVYKDLTIEYVGEGREDSSYVYNFKVNGVEFESAGSYDSWNGSMFETTDLRWNTRAVVPVMVPSTETMPAKDQEAEL